ncbi:MAG: phosphoribosylanthranilate isomerase [Polyangiaceae bacterium]
MTFVKICGITSVEDALLSIAAGADALGLNFVPTSKRLVSQATAAHILDSVGDLVEIVAVVANRSLADLEELRDATGIRWLQLHGGETPDQLTSLLPDAFKAVAVGSPEDVIDAARFAGDRLLIDAKSPHELGGTGTSFDWSMPGVAELVRQRKLIVAGGLRPENVAEAVRVLRPFGVDVASGVEAAGNPRQKDEHKLRAFVAAVRAAESGA